MSKGAVLENAVVRTARAARITLRLACLKLAEGLEAGKVPTFGAGSPLVEAAALRGMSLHYAAQIPGRGWRAGLRLGIEEIARTMDVHAGLVALAMASLIEKELVAVEPRAEAIAYLRELAGSYPGAGRSAA